LEGYSFFLLFFAGVCLAGIAVGVYIIYSAFNKGKGVDLPKENYVPFMPNLKQGQEWLMAIIGVVWATAMLVMFLAVMGAWIEYVFEGKVV